MALLFSPLSLREVTLSNRIVVPPMSQYAAISGKPTTHHYQHYSAFAAMGPGLVVIEATSVTRQGISSPLSLGLWDDEQEAALSGLITAVKSAGNAKIGLQLTHDGRKAASMWIDEIERPLSIEESWELCAPSAIPFAPNWQVPTELTVPQMESIKDAFAMAAERADHAGVDVLELHCAHGYLLHQFLSPISNHRSDAYGGSLVNRIRYPLEVIACVRSRWPAHKPLGMRVSGTEWSSPEFTLDEVCEFVLEAKKLGVDFVCVSSGGNDYNAVLPEAPGFQLHLAETIRRRTGVVVRAVGRITTGPQAEAALQTGQADLIAIGRAILQDENWVRKATASLGLTP